VAGDGARRRGIIPAAPDPRPPSPGALDEIARGTPSDSEAFDVVF